MTYRISIRAAGAAAIAVLGANSLAAQQKCPAVSGGVMPLRYPGTPTVAAITPCDLMTRLYIYADDSMRGRAAGTPDNIRATAYIAAEAKRMGLQPAGDSGGYFQWVPVFARSFDSASVITVGSSTFHGGSDFTAAMPENSKTITSAGVVFGGVANDTDGVLTPDQVRGKVLVVEAGGGGGGRGGFGGRGAGGRGGAAAQLMDPAQPGNGRGGVQVNTTSDALVQAMFGKPVDQLTRGAEGQPLSMTLEYRLESRPTRNVVAIWPGADPGLRGEYVAIGGHSDHNPPSVPLPHDSIKAYNEIARVEGQNAVRVPGAAPAGRGGRGALGAGAPAYQAMTAAALAVITIPNPNSPQGGAAGAGRGAGGGFGGGRGGAPITEAQWARINAIKDSLRTIYPERLDSINNGADDDGSGSVSTLEVAEAFARGAIKPKRSIIFVWHTGEERGLWGSQYFTNHPTVPRDSIVAQLNMDMVGRGAVTDTTGQDKDGNFLHGGDNYLQLVGSRRLSTELGDIVEQVNTTEKTQFQFDYAMDTNGHPDRIYCRSDHYNYARYGIPITFFTTGLHADYHQLTDEPEYIQYQHMARVDQLVFDVAVKVANLDHRVVVDKQKQASPFDACVQ